jgi:hypothetical protein
LAGELVQASSDAADRERRTQVRTNRRLRGMLAGTLLLLLVAVVAGVLAIRQRDDARAQALTSDAERVGAQALSDPNVDHSLLLAVARVKLQDRFETRSDLFADYGSAWLWKRGRVQSRRPGAAGLGVLLDRLGLQAGRVGHPHRAAAVQPR